MLLNQRPSEPAAGTPVPAPGSAHDRVYRALRTRIMHGEIMPGASLTLRGIGRDYGVSMTPARESVRRLVAEGALMLSSSGRVSTPELSQDRLEELAALRALLEPELSSRALPRAHMALIDRLQTINGSIAEAIQRHDAVGYIRSNLEFHRTLYLRAQAPAMLAMAETVWLQLGPTMRALYGRLNRTTTPYHHQLIVAALKAGDEPSLRLAVRGDVTQGLKLLAA
ncbi:GntR family transcriptional regulator [Pacificitalea manganoxidans]|uniref:GntR family transcriptional regulator n=1 Tax=Pacificitalea manganoxidans TaxID=1411902 RepID=A0A291M1H2_9RHOB|nr:GntR family transcriptional regulator [Pacificitalea manganoxidans]ATI42853.1 GntR family transcriptional regulator [Pacificitalea manganoxidans]MAQ46735.1 GntR family transcriptional regulator [Actibacterium sp.]MDR6307236.1 DNA-binding GntR family transcriptional regulator [Pacificitalea manganoxidans]OWU68775.1 GntR family transcriptional regulator [Roseovarius sp. 22II1-1F6A]|tara:strand:+ start:316 stop:990 length:675 start_codon:yes stop_codon:yes gene_type:complete